MSLFANTLLMIVSPSVGWEKIGRLSIPTKVLQGKVYFPTLAVLAVSTMFEMFFGSCTSTIAVINAIIALLINIVSNMLPSHFTILEFLKLYVAFILFRGLDYINYKEKPVFFVTVATLSVLIIPVAINYVLGLIIPVAN